MKFLLVISVLFAAVQPPTYSDQIAAILDEHCAPCHRANAIGPFTLTDYESARKRAPQLAYVAQRRLMPPWKAEPCDVAFEGERRLTREQIRLIDDWAAAGAPEGDPRRRPKPPSFSQGWALGQPDEIVQLPREHAIPAEGRDLFYTFAIPLRAGKERYVSAIQVMPSNPRVLHHVLVYANKQNLPSGKALAPQDPDSFLFIWSPGHPTVRLPEGIYKGIPAGSGLLVQAHYHATGREERDRLRIGLYYAGQPKDEVEMVEIAPKVPTIPADESRFLIQETVKIDKDRTLLGIVPHARLLCVEVRLTLRLPTGETKSLLIIRDWDFNWQDRYVLKEPLTLPKGSQLTARFIYDNSSANPRNPIAPPRPIAAGQGLEDETALIWLETLPAKTVQ